MAHYGAHNLKTWIAQAPIDEDFNRLENSIDNIKDQDLSFVGLPSIEGFKTDTIEPESGDITLESANFSDNLKGVDFVNAGYVTPYTMSATSENARRATVIDAGLVDYYHSRVDDIRIIETGKPDNIPFGKNGVFTQYSSYNGTGQIIIEEYKTADGYSKATVIINNITLGTAQTINIDSVGLSVGQYKKNYYNLGAGNIQITITEQTSRSLWEPAVFVRRCRYPIAENDTIRVLSTDYSTFEQRQITEADFTSFRIS